MGGLTPKEVAKLYAATLDVALRYSRSLDKAREATQELFKRVLAKPPWSEDKPAKFEWLMPYMAHAVINVTKNLRVAAVRRDHYEQAAGAERLALGGDAEAPAEARHIEVGERAERTARIGRLRVLLGDDPLGLRILDCIERGITEPADQARELGRPVEEIYAARKRRLRAMDRLRVPEPGDPEKKS